MSYPAHLNLNMHPTQHGPHASRSGPSPPPPTSASSLSAQASLQTSLNALNSKIVQAQSLALLNQISVDEVLSRMGGLNEMELGLLRLCAAREQEARLQASLMSQQQQQMVMLQQQQHQHQQQQSTRNPSNRLSFPGFQSIKSDSNNGTGSNGWEEGFANLSIGNNDVRTPTPKTAMSTQTHGSNPGGIMTPPHPTTSSRGEKRSSVLGSAPPSNASGKHEQAATWRSLGKTQQTPVSPAQTPGRSTTGPVEPAAKGFNFNGVFGNKVVPRQASQTSSTSSSSAVNNTADEDKNRVRTGRSGSASSSSASSDGAGSGPNERSHQQQRQQQLERSLAGRARELTFAGSTSSSESVVTPPPVLITPPCMPGDQFSAKQHAGGTSTGYFGIKKVVGSGDVHVHGQANTSGRNGLGVIGQGFGSAPQNQTGATSYGVVIRQPHGPPGGADELGNKNFASRLRQKAVSDLGLLGRRRANSPNPYGIVA